MMAEEGPEAKRASLCRKFNAAIPEMGATFLKELSGRGSSSLSHSERGDLVGHKMMELVPNTVHCANVVQSKITPLIDLWHDCRHIPLYALVSAFLIEMPEFMEQTVRPILLSVKVRLFMSYCCILFLLRDLKGTHQML